jgi:hypothetical protein
MSIARDARSWLSVRLGSEPLVRGDRRQYLNPEGRDSGSPGAPGARARETEGGVGKISSEIIQRAGGGPAYAAAPNLGTFSQFGATEKVKGEENQPCKE